MFDVAFEIGISPGAGTIIHPDRLVGFDVAVEGFRRVEVDLAKRDQKVWMNSARAINSRGIGQALAALRFEGFLGRDHEIAMG